METTSEQTKKKQNHNRVEMIAGPYMKILIAEAKKVKKKNIVVVFPDAVAFSAINNAINQSIIEHVFMIGKMKLLNSLINSVGADKSNYTLIEFQPDSSNAEVAATLMAVEIIKAKKAHMIMKGKINTASFVKGVLDKDTGIGTGRRLSLVCIFEVSGIDRLVILTDPGINPTLFPGSKGESGRDIIYNAVDVARGLGLKKPKVALIGANEVVSKSVPSSVLIKELSDQEWKRCELFGPLSYDIALYRKYAEKKGLGDNPVAGSADIIITPDIVSANVIYKSWITTANAAVANIVPGASVPLIISSRSDSDLSKFLTICSSVLYCQYLDAELPDSSDNRVTQGLT